jgi:hypothetical protein
LAHGHRLLRGSSLLCLLHVIQVAGVRALLRKCLSLLLDECRLLGLRRLELTLAADAVLDDLQLVAHLRVGRSRWGSASELKRTLTWVRLHSGCWRGQSGQQLLRLHSSRQFLGRDLSTEDIQHTLRAGATGGDVALLAQHLVWIGYSVRPHASHDDWATHRSDWRDRAGKSQRSRATQLERSAGGST